LHLTPMVVTLMNSFIFIFQGPVDSGGTLCGMDQACDETTSTCKVKGKCCSTFPSEYYCSSNSP